MAEVVGVRAAVVVVDVLELGEGAGEGGVVAYAEHVL